VDELATGSLRFAPKEGAELGCVAAVSCGTQVGVSREAFIWGSEGSLRIPNPWFPSEGDNTLHLTRAGKDPEEVVVSGEGKGLYTHEVDLVARCIAEGRTEAPSPAMTWADSLGNMQTLDAWRKSVGLVFDREKTTEK